MAFLTKELAQEIVERTMKILNQNINVMDENGIIIGSGDKVRLNQLHDGALYVLKQNESIEIEEDDAKKMKGAKPGINLPIRFHNQTVGVIGITGDPSKIRNYAQLVKMAAELVLEQSFLLERMQWKQRLQGEIVNQLIHEDEINEMLVKERANILGMDLDLPRMVILLESRENNPTIDYPKLMRSLQYELDKSDLIALTYNNNIVILKSMLARENDITPFLKRIYKHITEHSNNLIEIASGSYVTSIKDIRFSFINAQKTLIVGKKINQKQGIYQFDEFYLEVVLSQLDQVKQFSFYEELLKNDKNGELRATLHTFIKENGELNKVAESLFIHRNTLRYRLDKITEQTGKDPRKMKDIIELYVAKLLYEIH
ncbi:sugar diacid recognition domain-containing protein [Neobacillus sp. D3-1R]|uniref:sugar diacid recognition domain-containing protein n=1 Tax=Neobacillus sp. D3-1R TaxID=3445778 RepID=UPI003F9EFB0E